MTHAEKVERKTRLRQLYINSGAKCAYQEWLEMSYDSFVQLTEEQARQINDLSIQLIYSQMSGDWADNLP